MLLSAPLLALVLSLLPLQQDDSLGQKRINVQVAAVSQIPSTSRKIILELHIGDYVTVTAYQDSFAKVKLIDGTEGYVSRTALIPAADYHPGPANEKQMGEMKAQGYETGRFDPETEANYKKEKGPDMAKAFDNVDVLEKRQEWTTNKMDVSKRLDEFRKTGKLAEYSSVK